jgi:hypothetical protein
MLQAKAKSYKLRINGKLICQEKGFIHSLTKTIQTLTAGDTGRQIHTTSDTRLPSLKSLMDTYDSSLEKHYSNETDHKNKKCGR